MVLAEYAKYVGHVDADFAPWFAAKGLCHYDAKAFKAPEGSCEVVITTGSTFENAANLAKPFLDSITRKYQGTRLGRQELEAELLEDVEGALWTRDMMKRARIPPGAVPPLKRIVVAVDPAGSVGEDSDETALVVCGVGVDNIRYVVDAVAGKWLPHEWAARAINLYRTWRADRIVALFPHSRRLW